LGRAVLTERAETKSFFIEMSGGKRRPGRKKIHLPREGRVLVADTGEFQRSDLAIEGEESKEAFNVRIRDESGRNLGGSPGEQRWSSGLDQFQKGTFLSDKREVKEESGKKNRRQESRLKGKGENACSKKKIRRGLEATL